MPAPAVAAAYAALVSAYPTLIPSLLTAAPVIGVALFGLGLAATHNPESDLIHATKSSPQVTAECIQQNAGSNPRQLAAVVQPLFGNASYSVILKTGGVTGDAVMTVLIQEAAAGASVEFRPLVPDQTDLISRLIAGC